MPESLYVGTFEAVVSEMRRHDPKLDRPAAIEKAHAYVLKCGCKVVTVEKAGARVKYVVQADG